MAVYLTLLITDAIFRSPLPAFKDARSDEPEVHLIFIHSDFRRSGAAGSLFSSAVTQYNVGITIWRQK